MDILRILPDDAYQAAVNANAPSAVNPFATMADIGASDEWSEVLGNGNTTGGNHTIWSSGDKLRSAGISNLLATVVGPGSGTTLTGVTYSVNGNRSATIKVGATITITGTSNNDGVHTITAAETVGSGPYTTFFQFAGIVAEGAGGTVQTDNGALIIDFNNPDFYAPNEALDGYMWESNDGVGGAAKAWREFNPNYHQLGYGQAYHYLADGGVNNSAFTIYGSNYSFIRPFYCFNIIGENSFSASVGNTLFTKAGNMIIQENDTANYTTGNITNYPGAFIAQNTTINQNVVNSAAIGTNGAIVKTDNSTYVNAVAFNAGLTGEMRLVHTPNASDFTATLQAASGTIAYLSDLAGGGGIYGGSGNTQPGLTVVTMSSADTLRFSSLTGPTNLLELRANTNEISAGGDLIMDAGQPIRFVGTADNTISVDSAAVLTGGALTISAGEGALIPGTFGNGGDLNLRSGLAQSFAGQAHGDINITAEGGNSANGGNINISAGSSPAGQGGNIVMNIGTGAVGANYLWVPTVNGSNGVYIGGNSSDLLSVLPAFDAGTYQVAIGDANGDSSCKLAYFPSGPAPTGTQYVLANDGVNGGVVTWTDVTTLVSTPTLSAVLTAGNTTGANDIEVDTTQKIIFNGTGTNTAIDGGAVGFPFAGFQYRVLGDLTSEIYVGATITASGTNNGGGENDGTFVITSAVLDSGNTYFQWAGMTTVFGSPPGNVLTGASQGSINLPLATQTRTYDLPDNSGTIALLSDIPAGGGGLSSVLTAGDTGTLGQNINLVGGVLDLKNAGVTSGGPACDVGGVTITPGATDTTITTYACRPSLVQDLILTVHAFGSFVKIGSPVAGGDGGVKLTGNGEFALIGSLSGTNRTATFQDADGTVAYLTDIQTGQTYNVTNVTTDRDYDANASTVGELADVLGTLVTDLQNIGILS